MTQSFATVQDAFLMTMMNSLVLASDSNLQEMIEVGKNVEIETESGEKFSLEVLDGLQDGDRWAIRVQMPEGLGTADGFKNAKIYSNK